MKIKYLKNHITRKEGETDDVEHGVGNYLIRVGVAVEVMEAKVFITEPDFIERVEKALKKEKKEYKGLPTAKTKKKKP